MKRLSASLYFAANTLALLLIAGCVTQNEMKTQRSPLISALEHEMLTNTNWLRVHAAEGLLDNGESRNIVELFQPEADTATAPYRIGVWRILARATSGDERNRYIERIRAVMRDPQAVDRVSAAESIGKLNAASRADRDFISRWLESADDATAPFPRWLMVLSSNASERDNEEAALAKLLSSKDPVARLRAAFALGRMKTLSADSIARFRQQLQVEPPASIARVYLITALLLHVLDASTISALEKELVPYLKNGRANEQLEVGISAGLRGHKDDLKFLSPLLNNPEPDARIGAVNGMLRLLK